MATYQISPKTADRAVRLLAHHGGDIKVAMHDLRIGLESLGGYYTDRGSERVLELLRRLDGLTPERQQTWLTTMAAIAETYQEKAG